MESQLKLSATNAANEQALTVSIVSRKQRAISFLGTKLDSSTYFAHGGLKSDRLGQLHSNIISVDRSNADYEVKQDISSLDNTSKIMNIPGKKVNLISLSSDKSQDPKEPSAKTVLLEFDSTRQDRSAVFNSQRHDVFLAQVQDRKKSAKAAKERIKKQAQARKEQVTQRATMQRREQDLRSLESHQTYQAEFRPWQGFNAFSQHYTPKTFAAPYGVYRAPLMKQFKRPPHRGCSWATVRAQARLFQSFDNYLSQPSKGLSFYPSSRPLEHNEHHQALPE